MKYLSSRNKNGKNRALRSIKEGFKKVMSSRSFPQKGMRGLPDYRDKFIKVNGLEIF